MNIKSLKSIIFIIILLTSTNIIAQFTDNSMGVGASVGITEKAQLHFVLSSQNILSFEIGDVAISDGEFQLGNLGISTKYLFYPKDLTGYIGGSISYLRTNDDYLHFMVLLGVHKFVTQDVALFTGLNPGLIYPFEGQVSFLLSVELGAAFYF